MTKRGKFFKWNGRLQEKLFLMEIQFLKIKLQNVRFPWKAMEYYLALKSDI